jgi:NADP-dependent 3-hydroxy acid dehydrogenase YdfG
MDNLKWINEQIPQFIKKNGVKTMSEEDIKTMIETWGSMFWQIGLIYLTAFGMMLQSYLNNGEWSWNIMIYATVLDVLPITKAWVQSVANKKINLIQVVFDSAKSAWMKEKEQLKDELQAYKIKVGIFEADRTISQ